MLEAVSAKQIRHLRLRVARRKAVRARNEPPRLTTGEEAFNAISHGLGAVLAGVGFVLMLHKAQAPAGTAAACVYGISMVLMMLMSCVYHAMKAGSAAKRLCRRFDYTSIYLLIAGTFAPILLLYVGGRLGLALFAAQWAVILTGAALVIAFGPGRWRPLHFTLYFLTGWSGLFFLPSLYRNAPALLWFIFAGGLVYTLGMVPFARSRKYDHCVWHVCVLVAAALHWAGIYTQLF